MHRHVTECVARRANVYLPNYVATVLPTYNTPVIDDCTDYSEMIRRRCT